MSIAGHPSSRFIVTHSKNAAAACNTDVNDGFVYGESLRPSSRHGCNQVEVRTPHATSRVRMRRFDGPWASRKLNSWRIGTAAARPRSSTHPASQVTTPAPLLLFFEMDIPWPLIQDCPTHCSWTHPEETQTPGTVATPQGGR